jgi:hypothetical protein
MPWGSKGKAVGITPQVSRQNAIGSEFPLIIQSSLVIFAKVISERVLLGMKKFKPVFSSYRWAGST